jgi:hypothetical protein
MEQLFKEVFGKAKTIVGVTAIDASADTIAVNGRGITFVDISGNIWINPNITAVADATAFKLVAGDTIDLLVKGNLSIISDGSGGTYQYIIWDV